VTYRLATDHKGDTMTKKKSNILQFPVRPAKKHEDAHPRNNSVYVHKDSNAVLLDGEECVTSSDFTFVHRDATGVLMMVGQFDTIEEAKHAGRAYAEAFDAVFQS
jgi:hypothetical protein